MRRKSIAPVVVASIAVAVFIRCFVGYGVQFPINDGGLWYVVARTIAASGFTLPTQIHFNGEMIPFCYPPLAGYLIAALHKMFNVPLLDLIATTPFFLNIAAVLAFALFAGSEISNTRTKKLAIFLFPLTIQSYAIFLAGGGVSRNLGLAFQLLAWYSCLRATNHLQRGIFAGIFNGLAILSHPTGGLWSCLGILFYWAIEKRLTAKDFITITITTALVVSPWLISELTAQGFAPFLRAFQSSGDEMFSWQLFATPDRLILPAQSLRALAMLGLVVLVAERRLLAPALFLTALIFDHRGLFVLNGVVIGTLAAAYGLNAVLELIEESAHPPFRRAAKMIFFTLLGMHLFFSNFLFLQKFHGEHLRPTGADMEAYQQATSRMDNNARVLFLRSQSREPETGEWFSVISNHQIRPLPQGQEWIGRYGNEIDALNEISKCCDRGSWQCVRDAVHAFDLAHDVVAIHRTTCGDLAPSPIEETASASTNLVFLPRIDD